MNTPKAIYRKAKITPVKVGQFVSVWKRNVEGITEPRHVNDEFEHFVIQCKKGQNVGEFVFPKSILVEKGIISTSKKEGKRGFRVYPPWDKAENKQAIKTQEWQLDYFQYMESGIDS